MPAATNVHVTLCKQLGSRRQHGEQVCWHFVHISSICSTNLVSTNLVADDRVSNALVILQQRKLLCGAMC